jgi:uncharacterized membrane protein YfcA
MFGGLSTWQLGGAAGVIAVAYLVRGVAGFGSGLIAIPLLALMLPLKSVVPLVVLLDYFASAMHGVSNRKEVRWREILALVPFSLIGVVVALVFLARTDAAILSRALGLFIIGFALYTLSGYAPKRVDSRGWAALAGSAGGMVGTLFGTGGPFYVMYFKARGLEKGAFRATFATIFLLDGAGRLVGYVGSGFFTLQVLTMAAFALPIMGVFLYLGGHIHTQLSQQAFQRGISLLLIASGAALVLK